MSTSDEWIAQRTGIRERRMSPDTYRMLVRLAEAPDKSAFIREIRERGLDGQIDSSLTVTDQAIEASRMALKNAGLGAEDLDCIIQSSTLPELAYPAPGCVMQGRLGLTSTPVFNLAQGCDDGRVRPRMNGRAVFVNAVRRVREVVQECLDANGLRADDVDCYLFHQANVRIIEAAAEHFRISAERYFNNRDRYGNTAAASVPICLHEALAEGRIKDGDLVMLVAFGTGFSWGATLLRW